MKSPGWMAPLAAMAVAPLAAPASAEPSAQEIVDHIKAGDDIGLLYHVTLRAYARGISWANIEMRHDGRDQLYCPPELTDLTEDQMVEAFLRHVSEYPKDTGMPAALFMVEALTHAYPC